MALRILFHFPCPDGFGAAWSMYQWCLRNPPELDEVGKVYFHRESHRWETTKHLLGKKDTKHDHILYFDICPHLDLLEEIHSVAKDVRVFDHHKSAMDECGHLPYCMFDMNRSGAGIAWDEFMGKRGHRRPFMVDILEDQDLWKWKIPNSEKYLIVMETFKYDFDLWSEFSDQLEDPEGKARILEQGKAMDLYRQTIVRRMLGGKIHKLVVGGHKLPAVNACVLQSGVGASLARQGPAGAVYYTQGRSWNFSLRSTKDGLDVAKIAEQYGGGGHKTAAGFRVDSLDDLMISGIDMEDYTEAEQLAILQTIDPDFDPTSVFSVEPIAEI